ncbi:MAG: Spy/CpxP family protein refolding chaperone [Candidatus Eremiobacteraeota bacterium]|nr:Spy/CpxP family protein refolding chaperone [Candidatus Eremiobacteraeota bacterium]
MKKLTAMILVAVFLLTAVAFAGEMQVAARKGHGSMKDPIKTQKKMMKMHSRIKLKMAGSFFLLPMLQKELNLNDKQVEKLENMKADHTKKMIDKRADIAKAKVDLRLLMKKFNQDIPSIQRILQKISNLQVAMRVDKLKAFQQAKSVLTSAQKTKLEQYWKGKRGSSTKSKHKYKKTKMKKHSENTPEEHNKEVSWL